MKNGRKHKAGDKGRRTHAVALGAYGERALTPVCREGKVKLCSRTRAPVCVYDCCDVQHGISEGLNMQQRFCAYACLPAVRAQGTIDEPSWGLLFSYIFLKVRFCSTKCYVMHVSPMDPSWSC